MRKIVKRIATIILGILCLATTAIALEVKVVSVDGNAKIQTSSGWELLKVGDTLDSGDVVSTGFRSNAVLMMGESIIEVKPLTRMTIEALSTETEKDNSVIFIDAGSIAADVNHAPNKRVGFTVKSPVATASVRGTAGIVDIRGVVSTEGEWTYMRAVNPSPLVAKNTNKNEKQPDAVDALKTRQPGQTSKPRIVAKGSEIKQTSSGTIVTPQENNAKKAFGQRSLTQTQAKINEVQRQSVTVPVTPSNITDEMNETMADQNGNMNITPIFPDAGTTPTNGSISVHPIFPDAS